MPLRGPENATIDSIRENAEMVLVLTVKNKHLEEQITSLLARLSGLEESLCWIAEKNNTYVKDKEMILHIARASLNVHCGYDFKIDEKYSHLIDELQEAIKEAEG